MIQKIGVFTSGGDAPGMNAAIRAVVRAAIYYKKEVYGIMQGYEGMIAGDIEPLGVRSVSNIIQRGGTILKSARSKEFRTPEGRKKAFDQIKKHGIDGLIAIGGDGTFTGLHHFYKEFGVPSICMPGTIDNDISGTDYTIGYDTAVNTVVEAIDKIRDTAFSHDRLFFIEVMGRHSGYIALHSAVAGGAIAAFIPEEEKTLDELLHKIESGIKSNKKSSLVIVAEGSPYGGAMQLAEKFKERAGQRFDIKVTILGHQQRGGSPTCFDRVLASKLGVAAVEGLLNGKTDCMVGNVNHKVVFNPFDDFITKKQPIDEDALRISKILSI